MIGLAHEESVIRRGLRSLGQSVAILVIAALVGIYTLRDARTGLAIAAALLATSILFVDGGRRDFFVKHGWIPLAWVALCLAPDFRFTFRSTLDNSVSNASVENFIQVGVYALVAVLVLRARHILVTDEPRSIRKGPLIAWPSIAVLSTAWSLIPLFTFVRSLQLLVPIGLATVMARIWLSSPELAASLWRKTLRLFVQAVTLLVLLGFATGFWREPRFTWPGAHPGVAASYCAIALLILAGSRRSDLGFRTAGYVFRVPLFAGAVYLSQTRGVVGALALAYAVFFWWAGRKKPILGYLGMFYYAVAIALALITVRAQLIDYLERGSTTKSILSLTGRIPLWETSVDLVGEGIRWLTGFGYGAARVVLPLHSDWKAGTAHNSWVELLLSIGVLGPILLAACVVFLLRHASSQRALIDPRLTLSIVVFLLITSFTGETFVFPSFGFTTLALIHVPILAERSALLAGAGLGPEAARRNPVRSRTRLASGGRG